MSILCLRIVQRATGSPYLINPNPPPAHQCDCPPLYETAYWKFMESENAKRRKKRRWPRNRSEDVETNLTQAMLMCKFGLERTGGKNLLHHPPLCAGRSSMADRLPRNMRVAAGRSLRRATMLERYIGGDMRVSGRLRRRR